MKRIATTLLALAALAGCATKQDMAEINKAPAMSPVGAGLGDGGSVYAYPKEPAEPVKRFSLWDDRQSRLFTDPRALEVGDILTVDIAINDRAKFQNQSDRSRQSKRDLALGLGASWEGAGTEGEGNFKVSSNTDTQGAGATTRSENIQLSVAAVVTDVLPNGNLMITGSQEVRVNHELRILQIAGIVRPSDIGANNTISYERIAEARVSYGGRGRITEVQQPAYGQQFLDHVLPF